MPLDQIVIKSKLKNYDVFFCESPSFLVELVKLHNALFVIDQNVWKHHHNGALKLLNEPDHIVLPIDEERKTLVTVQELYDQIITRAPKKNMTLVSIGGGILQDITGFVASTLYRGINWIFIPTTLLAQADSCIGSKTSLNYRNFKNLIGTFYPPTAAYLYPPFLKTQEKVDFFSGAGEVVKLHLMGGEKDTGNLLKMLPGIIERDETVLLKAIKRSLLIKQSYIEVDEFDTGRRNLLNFGHCFGHAIESATDFAIPHGLAVVMGIMLAGQVAVKRKMLKPEQEFFLREKILYPVMRIDLKRIDLDQNKIIAAMKQDKKRTGQGLPLVILKDGYAMERIDNLKEEEAAWALDGFKHRLEKK